MWIDSSLSSAALTSQLSSQVAARQSDSGAEFSIASTPSSGAGPSASTGEAETAREKLLAKLKDYIDKGPVAAMRDKILKSMGLTEEDLKAKSPDEQKAIEDEISKKIKDFLLEHQSDTANLNPGVNANGNVNANAAPQAAVLKTDLYSSVAGL